MTMHPCVSQCLRVKSSQGVSLEWGVFVLWQWLHNQMQPGHLYNVVAVKLSNFSNLHFSKKIFTFIIFLTKKLIPIDTLTMKIGRKLRNIWINIKNKSQCEMSKNLQNIFTISYRTANSRSLFLQWFVNLFGALTVLCFFFIIILANYHYSSKDNHKP